MVECLKTVDANQISHKNFGIEAWCELDTHADTCCAGINCQPIFFTGQHCKVQGFHDDFAPMPDILIATVVTAWSDSVMGKGYVLILHKVLYFVPNMKHSLINPN